MPSLELGYPSPNSRARESPLVTDEAFARRLQMEEDVDVVLPGPPRIPDAMLHGRSDEALARELQEEEEQAHFQSRLSGRETQRVRALGESNCDVRHAHIGEAVFGCFSGMQLGMMLGFGQVATWLCALGGGLAAAGYAASRGQVRSRRVEMDSDDDDDDMPVSRGLDIAAIEGHTVGHVYSAQPSRPNGRPTSESLESTSRGLAEASEDNKCMVCFEIFASGDALRSLPCLHKYHRRCIDEWLSRSPHCPICKCDITAPAQLSHMQRGRGPAVGTSGSPARLNLGARIRRQARRVWRGQRAAAP